MIYAVYIFEMVIETQGYIYTVSVNSHTGSLSRTHKNKSSKSKSPITTIQYRTFSLMARCPVLLSCAQDGNLSFFRCVTFMIAYYMVDFT
jgi:WD repeat-containing protein 13